jgi:hypothetical protein
MKWNKKFDYPPSIRSLINDQRHYDINGAKLPSVTTILQATQSEEKKAILAKWKQNVGEIKADQIRDHCCSSWYSDASDHRRLFNGPRTR